MQNKLTNALNILNTVSRYFPVAARKTIYYTLVNPYLTYGNALNYILLC